jgi:hypothetical protein
VNLLAVSAVVVLATVAVGLTASTDGLFSIVIRPVFLDLGFNVDVKLGSVHLHANWSALPQPPAAPPSTKCEPE